MAKWVCPVCGYVHEGDTPPEKCPICNVPGEKFTLQAEEKTWAAEHIVGVGKVFGEGAEVDRRVHAAAARPVHESELADLSHGKAHGERGRLPLFPHSCHSAQAEFPALHPAMPPRQKAA